ncbi:zinc-ribbon domain-containing protein, partial [Salmonella enterica]
SRNSNVQNKTTKFCPNCGNQIDMADSFCSECGNQL